MPNDPRRLESDELTEDALALRFTARHGHELRYVAAWGRWLHWTRGKWNLEQTLLANSFARAIAREASAECAKPGLASAKTAAAILRLAQADRRHAATPDQWDSDAWLLNTPDGVIDLQTGELLRHDPERYITKSTTVGPAGSCPLWRAFLHRITDGDTELQKFLQRVFGYALTGSVREHALFFLHGTGGNGKSVLLNTVSAIFGDYAVVAPMETLIATKGEQHPTNLAGLRGARLVTASETERGRNWAERKIKVLTGGDPIAARFMRQDFFTYQPRFKLVIAGNHKPELGGVDEAMQRRFYMVPFRVTVPERERDKVLPEKLRAEWSGILEWMLEGCLEWQCVGLAPPAIVRETTCAYFGEEDALGRWLEECCTTGRQLWCEASRLWESWRGWCERNNEPVGSTKAFGVSLDQRGFSASKSCGNRGRNGINLGAE